MTISRVQFAHAEASGDGTTIACTVNGITPAALIVHDVAMAGGVRFVSTLRDDLSVDAEVAIVKTSSLENLEQWYHKNHGGGNRTFTVTYDATVSFRGIVSTEYAGADPVAPLQGTASSNGTGTVPTSGDVTPAPNADGVLIAGFATGDSPPTAVAPFSEIFQDAVVTFCESEDYVQPAAAPIAATWGMTPSGNWAALAGLYLPASLSGAERSVPYRRST